MTKVYEKNIPENGIECLKLVVFPPNKEIQNNFEQLYTFDKSCEIQLLVEAKGGITCNSEHNLQKKAMGTFPSSYLNLQVTHNSKKIYSYYIDLKEDVSTSDIKSAFKRMKEDISLN